MKIISVFYCLLYAATWTEGASINVEGFEWGEVSFQCSHKLAWKNHKYLCKDPCNSSKDILVTVQSGARVQSGRIILVDSGNGDFTVTFSQLQLSDSGKYWCAVDRPGFDTFTAIQLTVNEAVANKTTTVMYRPSPTRTYQDISNSTQSTSGTNLSTASNHTRGGEQNISTGTVLYATVAVVATLTVLVLAMCFRKRRRNSKPQPQVCSTDLVIADEEEQADSECNKTGEEAQSIKTLSERFSCAHHPKQDPPASAATAVECSESLHIYENVCCSTSTRHSRYSAANVQDKHDINSAIYIKPLPPIISERSDDGSLGKHTNKARAVTSKPIERSTGNASACHTRSCTDTEVRPKLLWFGLDVSGTI